MDCCFAFLRRTEADSRAVSDQQSSEWPLSKVQTTGLRGECSSRKLSDSDAAFRRSALEKDRKGLPQNGQTMSLWLSKLAATFRSKSFADVNEIERKLSLSVSLASTKSSAGDANRDDRSNDDERNECEISSSLSCLSRGSSSEDDVPALSFSCKTHCSDGAVTLFRQWTNPNSLAAHDRVTMVKPNMLSEDHVSVTEALQQWFDPLLLSPSRCQRRATSVR
eukprot:TRINITY_DN8259_c0_g1_i2.p1 TRINITY_DN8259_c0_g1~~TRINITY_DN8259_c0_g1_i2.p1  ORF type:complete len:222 (+),score=25.52 TRINITY_DN8259_c0_g1_i2:78-743(+)